MSKTGTIIAKYTCQQCHMRLEPLFLRWFRSKPICEACLKQQFRKAN